MTNTGSPATAPAEFTVGQTVQYTNRKGDTYTGKIVVLIPAEVFGAPRAVVEFTDGPLTGGQKRFAFDQITAV